MYNFIKVAISSLTKLALAIVLVASYARPAWCKNQSIVTAQLLKTPKGPALSFYKPCNAHFGGIFLKPKSKNRPGYYGVVVKRSSHSCTALPKYALNHINVKIAHIIQKWLPLPATELSKALRSLPLTFNPQDHRYAWINHSCEKPVGLLLDYQTRTLAALASVKTSKKKKTCENISKKISLNWLPKKLRFKPKKTNRLGFRYIKPESLRYLKSGFLDLKYLRHCGERPIGLHYHRRWQFYSMLVARYPLLNCKKKRLRWSRYQTSTLAKQQLKVKKLKKRQIKNLHNLRVNLLPVLVSSKNRSLKYRTYAGCTRPHGVVIYENHWQLKIGLTQLAKRADKCRNYRGSLRLFGDNYDSEFFSKITPLNSKNLL